MHKSILSDLERRRIKAFIKADGKKETFMTVLAARCRKHLPKIREDLVLIEGFMATYEGKPRTQPSDAIR